ncbi:unnamed protein product [Acanthoscelides obtectus]|uniref:PHD finger protein 20 n=1 Tax=Acanthoscelides obtectus TaxID=200917 RepID=A0A9P0L2F6_ACAOB|nr:unnamed protein product [Acanthoscelides obtectus]CAK1637844.1 PHD finger protein 20 [Acanthoscelides obtectus]
MGRKCSVESCLSDSNRPEDIGVTFHKVPMHPDVRPKWMSLCHIPDDKKAIKIIYVCSRHFLRADFCNFKGKKYMLRQGVLPSVFPWDKSKLEAIKAEATIKKEKNVDEVNMDVVKEELEDSALDIKSEESTEASNQTIEDVKEEPEEKKPDEKQASGDQPPAVNNSDLIDFTINNRIEALDFNQEWYPAKILEVDHQENEVLIHFEKFSSKYDEWVSMSSSRLRPLQQQTLETVTAVPPASKKVSGTTEQFEVGERCLAAWSNSQKFPATVSKVLENNAYEVLFDDGFVKTLKGHRMSKSGAKPLQASPLFEPIQSSKQDRREKKKKLNVATLFKKRQRAPTGGAGGGSGSGGEAAEGEKPAKKVRHKAETPLNVSAAADTEDIQNWRPLWHKGRPIGTDAMLETSDGIKHTVIVPDPRLPEGWAKHLLRRNIKGGGVRWDTIIVSPENRRFRSKYEIRVYLEANPIGTEGIHVDMFDFCLVKSKPKKVKRQPTEVPELAPVPPPPVLEPQEDSQMTEEQDSQDEDNSNSLKILFEDNAFKCPIEGCGKNFRRENLAQMHVKHYHPEYTKFLDSTPNVADLAYARTVGENLDKSPGPSNRPPVLKPATKASTPKTSKLAQSPHPEMPDLRPMGSQSPNTIMKCKDAEIIKLLNAKPSDKNELDTAQGYSSGVTPVGYPDMKLKDLLNKSEGVPKRDELSKPFTVSRSAGIKTLLPIVRQQVDDLPQTGQQQQPASDPHPPATTAKRKRLASENPDHSSRSKQQRGTPPPLPPQTAASDQNPSTPPVSQPPVPVSDDSQTPTAQKASPVTKVEPPASQPDLPPNNIIIEGGEVIKIVRMKQEEIINCTCGYTEEDGLMIQCELCLCWQHAYCNNIERESQVPEKYVCYICQNPFRERMSRKYYHDQDWLKQGILPTGSYHSRDEEQLQKRFEKLKKCHDLSGGLQELRDYMHSLAIKLKIAEMKNHPKLYLWAKMWEKHPLPEKIKEECEETKHKIENEDHQYIKSNEDPEKQEKPDDSMLMMILKAGKEVMPKIDLNLLMDNNMSQLPIIPQPEAAIDSTVCRDNLLQHIRHQESLVEERLDDFERQIDALEECVDMEVDMKYPKMRHSLQMLARDLEKLKEFSHTTTI